MSTEETVNETPMHRLIESCDGNIDVIGDRISGVLEFLTVRAALDAPFVIYADNKESIVVIAAGDDVEPVAKNLPDHFKNWDDELDTIPSAPEVETFLTDIDPGDEQDDETE
jgi:hypothetical protein